MKNKKITFEFENELQQKTMIALFESFQEKSINMDKFLIWVLKNYDVGTSIFLRMLNN